MKKRSYFLHNFSERISLICGNLFAPRDSHCKGGSRNFSGDSSPWQKSRSQVVRYALGASMCSSQNENPILGRAIRMTKWMTVFVGVLLIALLVPAGLPAQAGA